MRSLVLAVALILILAVPPRARAAGTLPFVTAPSAVVVNGWTGNVLFAKDANQERYPASTVKIMTALLVLKHDALSRIVTVSPLAAGYGGSSAYLYAGETLTVWNLLHAMLLPSGNDAAVALAQATGGSLPRFVWMMNREAAALGLRHTHFLSPNGFDQWGQETTALDLARLTRIAMHNRRFVSIVRDRYWSVRLPARGTRQTWTNTNRLLWMSRYVDGVKTGTTNLAGACLVSSVREHGRWVIAVNLGSQEASRFADGMRLLDFGLQVAAPRPTAD